MQANSDRRLADGRPVSIHRKDGRTFAAIDDLLLIAEGETADEAIAKLDAEVRTRRALFADAGAVGPAAKSDRLTPFFLKTAAVALACVVVLVTLDLVAMRTFANLPRRAASMALATVGELGQLSQWVSDERKREIGRNIRLLIEAFQPVVDEVAPAFLSNQSPPPPTSGEPAKQ